MTVPLRDASSFALQLSKGGPSWHSIGLHGRFHHPIHSAAIPSLKDLCKRDKRFQFLSAERKAFSLRSQSTSDLIIQDPLHDIALDSILAEQSHWFRTVRAAVASIGSKKVEIITVGAGSFVPRSITTELKSQSFGSQIPNGVVREQSVPYQPNSHPETATQNDVNSADSAFPGSAIAVVGMACRFPEADSPEKFWQLINSGVCAVQHLPKDRFDTSQLWRDPKGPFFGNFLRDPAAFDNRFFGISGREAKSMDPQQRLLLQVAYEAMESSGYFGLRSDEPPSDIGCYVGVGAVDYGDNVASHDATAFSASGTLRAFVSGKVSHYFGWSGPSITYDTACSSSAVAIHSACKVSVVFFQANIQHQKSQRNTVWSACKQGEDMNMFHRARHTSIVFIELGSWSKLTDTDIGTPGTSDQRMLYGCRRRRKCYDKSSTVPKPRRCILLKPYWGIKGLRCRRERILSR